MPKMNQERGLLTVWGLWGSIGVISELGFKGGLGFAGGGGSTFHVEGRVFTVTGAWTGVAGSGRVGNPADCGPRDVRWNGGGAKGAGEGSGVLEALDPPYLLWAHLFFVTMSTRGQARKGSEHEEASWWLVQCTF